jgi:hypothetical protein
VPPARTAASQMEKETNEHRTSNIERSMFDVQSFQGSEPTKFLYPPILFNRFYESDDIFEGRKIDVVGRRQQQAMRA